MVESLNIYEQGHISFALQEQTIGVDDVNLVLVAIHDFLQQTQNVISVVEMYSQVIDDRIPRKPDATYHLNATLRSVKKGEPSHLFTMVDDDDFLDY